MTHSDFQVFTNFLHALYLERFPGLTPEMAQLWYDDLQGFPAVLVTRGVKRWARQHTLKAPSLDELLESIEWVQDADRRAHLPTPHATMFTVLEDAVLAAAPRGDTADNLFGRCMLRCAEHLMGIRPRWTRVHCGTKCRQWATHYAPQYPALAEWLCHAAGQFEAMEEPPLPAPFPRMVSLAPLGTAQVRRSVIVQEGCIHEYVNAQDVCNDCGEILVPHVA